MTEVMTLALDLLSWFLILVGGAFGIIGGIGLLRLPDFFSRIHAASLTDSMCAPCIIGGLMLQSGLTLVTVKLAFLIVFLFLTSPTASHALAKAALHGGLHPGEEHPSARGRQARSEGDAANEGARG
jgi:multicomponent Na+:H+ antiporter subunit G